MDAAVCRFAVTVLLAACAALVPATSAHAWGAKGHRLTALVAEQLLSPSARAQVKLILGSEGLADAALYLDIHRDELQQQIHGSKDWHFDDRPSCDAAAPISDYCPDGQCASFQLKRHQRDLSFSQGPLAERRFALRVVAHLAGDIHQPLHTADHDDSGGNGIRLSGPWLPSGKHGPNLHSVWDKDFVALALAVPAFQGKAERQVAALLASQITDDEKSRWRKGPVSQWMKQSYDLAVKLAYSPLPGFACAAEGFAAQALTLPESYVTQAVASIPEQLKKGGLRLAAMLNRALSSAADAAGPWVRVDKL